MHVTAAAKDFKTKESPQKCSSLCFFYVATAFFSPSFLSAAAQRKEGLLWPRFDDNIRKGILGDRMWNLAADAILQRHSNLSLEEACSSLSVVHCRNSLACSATSRKGTHTHTHVATHTQWCLTQHYQRTHWCGANGISLAVRFPKSKAFRSLPFSALQTLLLFQAFPASPPPPNSATSLPNHPLPIHSTH